MERKQQVDSTIDIVLKKGYAVIDFMVATLPKQNWRE
jgi:hypothetical protein